ncbi:MAG: SGNH/GDSL hydrolase family protein [Fibrobacteria bacterium]|nr:SGNH/GDSL hydrolase family protein [Fibrobacteria bacterium]
MTIIKNILLFLVTTTIIMLVAEFGFRVYSDKALMYDIEMHKYAKKLKRPSTTPGLSHEHIPGGEANLMGVDVKINNYGLREAPISKSNNDEFRLLILGSSITFGWGVPYKQVFTHLLEEKLSHTWKTLPKINVINAGIGNYNTEHAYALYQKLVSEIKPDLVVLHYFINDAEIVTPTNAGFLVEHSYLAAFFYIRIKQILFARGSEIKNLGDYYLRLYQDDATGWQTTKNMISNFHQASLKLNQPFIVLMQPDLHDLSKGSGQETCHTILKAFLNEKEIRTCDLLPAFRDAYGGNPQVLWTARDDSHPNAQGHALMAQIFHEYLLKEFPAYRLTDSVSPSSEH